MMDTTTATPTHYVRREQIGCVVDEIRAVQFDDRDPMVVADRIREAFGDVVIGVMDLGRELQIEDLHGDRLTLGWHDYLFEQPGTSGHLLVLSRRNFEDTFEVSPLG